MNTITELQTAVDAFFDDTGNDCWEFEAITLTPFPGFEIGIEGSDDDCLTLSLTIAGASQRVGFYRGESISNELEELAVRLRRELEEMGEKRVRKEIKDALGIY